MFIFNIFSFLLHYCHHCHQYLFFVAVVVGLAQELLVQLHYQHQHQVNLEEHLVKIAEPEQQNRVARQFAFDTAILRHHGSELRFSGHGGEIRRDCASGRNFSIHKIVTCPTIKF